MGKYLINDLDDAIKHCEEKEKEQALNGCFACAEEHKQLAEWLKQLKAIKEAYKTGEVINLVAECMSIWGELG